MGAPSAHDTFYLYISFNAHGKVLGENNLIPMVSLGPREVKMSLLLWDKHVKKTTFTAE